MFNKKRLVAILTGTLLVGSLVGCSAGGASNSGSGSSDSSKITISGSTSVGPLMEKESEIVVVSREEGSGTRDVFQKIVGYTSEELINNAIIGDGSGNIKTTVAGNNHAIGFISFEYLDDSVNKVKIDGIEPNVENVKDNKYKLARTFLLVYKEEYLKENGNKLIDFVLSEEGQNIVEENGLIRIK